MGELSTITTAQIASISDREKLLEKTVASLLHQVDQLNIILNAYESTPSFVYKPKIAFYHLDNEKGDAGKFYGLQNIEGYVFTCDDDLIYPPDYVETMTKELKKYNNSVILTNHGRTMLPKPVANSYTSRRAAYHWRDNQPEAVKLDIGGTGAMAWHSSAFFPDYNRIDKANMADIWVAMFAHEQGVEIRMNPHRECWLKYMEPEWTIWDEHYPNPQEQTDLYNSF